MRTNVLTKDIFKSKARLQANLLRVVMITDAEQGLYMEELHSNRWWKRGMCRAMKDIREGCAEQRRVQERGMSRAMEGASDKDTQSNEGYKREGCAEQWRVQERGMCRAMDGTREGSAEQYKVQKREVQCNGGCKRGMCRAMGGTREGCAE